MSLGVIRRIICWILILGLLACEQPALEMEEETDEPGVHHFDVNDNHILKNGDPFFIKGVVYVPAYPGFLPWEIENATTLPPEIVSRPYRLQSSLALITPSRLLFISMRPKLRQV